MAAPRGDAFNALLVCVTVLVLTVSRSPAAAQFIVRGGESTCPTNRYFVSSPGDSQPALAALSGLYTGTRSAGYRHELGHAVLRSYVAEGSGASKQTWYIAASDTPASSGDDLPPAGPVAEGDTASPRGYLRSSSPTGDNWERWSNGRWERVDAGAAAGAGGGDCGGAMRLRCVGKAWRCPAGRLLVTGMPVGDMKSSTMKGSLVGSDDESTFSKELVTDDDPTETVSAPLPAPSDSGASAGSNSVLLGTFLMTDQVHMDRPVYRKAGSGAATFLYFDRLETDDEPLPMWIIGQQPSQLDLAKSRMFFVVDSAARPEEITGCWQYRVGGQQSGAHLNVTCEHGRTPAGPGNGADCDFELPGACGYRASQGTLSQEPYSDDQLDKALAAGDSFPGKFFGQMTSAAGGVAEALSMQFEVTTNSCISFDYRMRTDAFFSCTFSLEEAGVRYSIFTMSAASRDWMRIERNVTAGSYRLHVRTSELAEGDQLQMDSVRVSPGSCGRHTASSPCDRQPCGNGGTCVPTGNTTYTCLCRRQFQGRDCRATAACPAPPRITYGAPQLLEAPDDVLPTARYSCRPDYELVDPLVRSTAVCLAGRWQGVPQCQQSVSESAELSPRSGRSAAGGLSSPGAAVIATLLMLTALRAA